MNETNLSGHNEPRWLVWARALEALAQTGLHFCDNLYDIERYHAVRRIAAEMMAEQSQSELRPILDLFRHDTGYATPKVDVRAVAFRDDKILLVKERMDGKWTTPGGWADVNDPPSVSALRELHEEAGFEGRAVKLLAVYDRAMHPHEPPFPYHVYKLFFLCELTGGSPNPDSEIEEVGFFAEDELPELSITRITPQQIARFFEHHRHPEWPTDFD